MSDEQHDRIVERLKLSLSLGDDELSRLVAEKLRDEAGRMRKNGETTPSSGNPEVESCYWYSLTPEECGDADLQWRSIDEDVGKKKSGPAPSPASKSGRPQSGTSANRDDVIVIRAILVDKPEVYKRLHRRNLSVVARLMSSLKDVNAWSISGALHLILVIIFLSIVSVNEREDREIVSFTLGRPAGMDEPKQAQGEKGIDEEKPPTKEEKVEKKEEEKKEDKPDPNEEKKETVAEKKEDVSTPAPEVAKREPTNEQLAGAPSSAPKSSGKPGGSSSPLSGRGGSAKGDALKEFGGDKLTERAVDDGLKWLMKHQSDNGAWSANRFVDRCPAKEKCGTLHEGLGNFRYDPGLTGLSLLCFLGAGYTHKNESVFRETVERTIAFLRSLQQSSGLLDAADQRNMYNHSIATLALAEAYAMTNDPSLKNTVRKAVRYLEESQQQGGGWDYSDDRTNRNDVSISGWAIMALRAASVGGIEVSQETLEKTRTLIERRTVEKSGEVVYAEKGVGSGRKGNGVAAVGILLRIYLGMKDAEPIQNGALRLLANRPDWDGMVKKRTEGDASIKAMIDNNIYYWYYGTLAMFHLGGEYWQKWNEALKENLLNKQCLVGHRAGSWDPDDGWMSQEGGRIYSTTLNVLNLEIYYRYIPTFAAEVSFEIPHREELPIDKLRRQIASGDSQREKEALMEQLTKFPFDSEKVADCWKLLLGESDPYMRFKTVKTLVGLKNPKTLPLLKFAILNEKDTMKGIWLKWLGENFSTETSLIDFVMDFIEEKQEDVRNGAIEALRKLTGQNFGNDADKWREWQRQNRKK